MIGEEAIGRIINGFIQAHAIDKWAKFIVSMTTSAVCTFLGTFGAGTISHLSAGQKPAVSLSYGVAEGSIAAAAVVLHLWKRSKMIKGIPLVVPMPLEASESELLRDKGLAVEPGGQT